MPILGTIIPILGNWRVWIAAGVAMWALGTYALYERGEAAIARLDTFKAQIEAVSAQAILRNKEIEHANKSRINVALSYRDAQLARLRKLVQEGNAGRGVLPAIPADTASGGKLCFEPSALAAAIDRYRQRITGVVAEGDSAQIDATTLIQAWPR